MNNGTKTSTPLGPIGVWINGVAVFNALDAQSYNNQNIWHQNAVVVEASSFDACLGHPAPGGVYHHHQNPRCLYAADSSSHSPLIGYTFDGFPVYGPYGYTNPDGSGGIKRLRSSYRPRNITQRTSLPDGTVLSPSQYGPDVSVTYPLGYYVEDFEYADGSGDLDRYNGRLTVTPDYPDSVYAYVATVDSDGNSAYPYFVGPQYYGVVETGNITSHGHVAVSESVMTYSPETAIREGDPHPLPGRALLSQNYPNPFNPSTTIRFAIPGSGFVVLSVFDVVGREVATLASRELTAGEYDRTWIAPGEASGVYYCRLRFTPDQGGSPSQAAPFVTTKKLLLLR
jgi:hypothetical protein